MMNFNEIFALFIIFYLAWTFVIHFIDENTMALIILLMVFLNIISAAKRAPILMENHTSFNSPNDFALYLFHIVVATGFLIWYIVYSFYAVANTIDIWQKGFFGFNKTSGKFGMIATY